MLIFPASTISTISLVGDADAVPELRLDPEPIQHLVDLRTAAVDDDRVDPDVLQQHHVLCEPILERRVRHRMAAVFHDDGLAAERADVRQGFDQDVGLLD
jgi:hypothetical protein